MLAAPACLATCPIPTGFPTVSHCPASAKTKRSDSLPDTASINLVTLVDKIFSRVLRSLCALTMADPDSQC